MKKTAPAYWKSYACIRVIADRQVIFYTDETCDNEEDNAPWKLVVIFPLIGAKAELKVGFSDADDLDMAIDNVKSGKSDKGWAKTIRTYTKQFKAEP